MNILSISVYTSETLFKNLQNILTNFKAVKFSRKQPVTVTATVTLNKDKTDCKTPQVLMHKQTNFMCFKYTHMKCHSDSDSMADLVWFNFIGF